MGVSETVGRTPCRVLTRLTDAVTGTKKLDGACTDDVFGTYVHGFFDSGDLAADIVSILAARKGISLEETLAGMTLQDYKNKQYDHLADVMRAHLDMPAIYRILEEGI